MLLYLKNKHEFLNKTALCTYYLQNSVYRIKKKNTSNLSGYLNMLLIDECHNVTNPVTMSRDIVTIFYMRIKTLPVN